MYRNLAYEGNGKTLGVAGAWVVAGQDVGGRRGQTLNGLSRRDGLYPVGPGKQRGVLRRVVTWLDHSGSTWAVSCRVRRLALGEIV